MSTNIQQINDHNHDGATSALLASTTQTISAGAWAAAAIGGGLYKQTVTVPTGFSYDTSDIWFKLSTGEKVYPSLERTSATQYVIYTNDNSLAYTARYR